MNLSKAYMCIECEEIAEDTQTCPKCGGKIMWCLALWLNRTQQQPERKTA